MRCAISPPITPTSIARDDPRQHHERPSGTLNLDCPSPVSSMFLVHLIHVLTVSSTDLHNNVPVGLWHQHSSSVPLARPGDDRIYTALLPTTLATSDGWSWCHLAQSEVHVLWLSAYGVQPVCGHPDGERCQNGEATVLTHVTTTYCTLGPHNR